MIWRCSNCKRENSAKFDTSTPVRQYTTDSSRTFFPILVVECRGLEFIGFDPVGTPRHASCNDVLRQHRGAYGSAKAPSPPRYSLRSPSARMVNGSTTMNRCVVEALMCGFLSMYLYIRHLYQSRSPPWRVDSPGLNLVKLSMDCNGPVFVPGDCTQKSTNMPKSLRLFKYH